VVTTSTSLELGIDMPHLDLVVQVGSPKSVAALLQRVGRAGHSPGETVEGRMFALDRDELVECAAMLARAEEGFVDGVSLPEGAADVAAQHVYGMAINQIRPDREIREVLRRAHPYREFGTGEYERLMRYLTGDYEGLAERNVYPKVWRDANDPPDGEHHHEEYPVGETLVGKAGRLARVIYMTNVGTIPDSFGCDVVTRDGEAVGTPTRTTSTRSRRATCSRWAASGSRSATAAAQGVRRPDRRAPDGPHVVRRAAPAVGPIWRRRCSRFRPTCSTDWSAAVPAVRAWLRELPIDGNSVRAITRTYDEQVAYAGAESVSTPSRLAVEEVCSTATRTSVGSTSTRRTAGGSTRGSRGWSPPNARPEPTPIRRSRSPTVGSASRSR